MLVVVLQLVQLAVVFANIDHQSNVELEDVSPLNALDYGYRTEVISDQAVFDFTVRNVTYAMNVLDIRSYYISITFVNDNRQEERLKAVDLPRNETTYTGHLKMQKLEEKSNYLVCVFFLAGNVSRLIGSSRFCHVISVGEECLLDKTEKTFNDRHIMVLVIFAVVFFVLIVVISIVRKFIYRPRNIDALLDTLPSHHVARLRALVIDNNTSRGRQNEETLNRRIREDSVITVDFDPNGDHDFQRYHGRVNPALDTLQE